MKKNRTKDKERSVTQLEGMEVTASGTKESNESRERPIPLCEFDIHARGKCVGRQRESQHDRSTQPTFGFAH